MISLLESSSWVVSALIIVTVSILICSGFLWAIRRACTRKELKKNHDVVGFTFSIIGVLYSVILGFTVISVQTRYDAVLQAIHTEAILLADLYQDAAFFSKKDTDTIRSALRQYTHHVVKEEWGLPVENPVNIKSRFLIKNIWKSYYTIDLQSARDNIWYTESISKLNSFLNARLARQFNSREHLGEMMWSLLIIGAIITICFMFFFGLENFRSHMLMTALLAGYVSFMLFLVYSLDNVFSGPQRIKPVALEQVYTLFDQLDQDSLLTAL